MSDIRLHSTAELLALPEPEWLIQDHIHCEETVALWGAPNMGKSFISIDMALSVASGLPWLNTYPVKQCPVVYMAGEGGASLKKRVEAWMVAHEVREIPGAYWQLRSIPFRDEDIVEEVQEALANYMDNLEHPSYEPGLNAGLIVIDTLSQFFGSGDENGPDMAGFVGNIRRLSQEAGVAVLIVHHSNAGGARERGHSALRGNVDVMFKVEGFKKDEKLLGMSMLNDKQRDNPNAPKLYFDVRAVRDGLVVYPSDAQKVKQAQEQVQLTDPKLIEVLRAFELVEDAKSETCRHNDLIEQTGLKRQRLHERLKVLKNLELITKAGQGKSALTLRGRDTIATALREQAKGKKRYGAGEDNDERHQ